MLTNGKSTFATNMTDLLASGKLGMRDLKRAPFDGIDLYDHYLIDANLEGADLSDLDLRVLSDRNSFERFSFERNQVGGCQFGENSLGRR